MIKINNGTETVVVDMNGRQINHRPKKSPLSMRIIMSITIITMIYIFFLCCAAVKWLLSM